MAANVQPIYPNKQNVSWGTVSVGNTAKDGTGVVSLTFTAGPNGSKIDQIKVRSLGTNVATVLRFFVNNGQANSSPPNNSLAHEVTVAATTVSESSALLDIDVTIPKNTSETACPIPYLPAGYKINVAIGTSIAAGLQVTVFGADY